MELSSLINAEFLVRWRKIQSSMMDRAGLGIDCLLISRQCRAISIIIEMAAVTRSSLKIYSNAPALIIHRHGRHLECQNCSRRPICRAYVQTQFRLACRLILYTFPAAAFRHIGFNASQTACDMPFLPALKTLRTRVIQRNSTRNPAGT